ncbi:hypothetical protein [Sinorhizobium chiapasense]|uniref:Uncharacterized protein n=1 Tax=Sinorhizobium chiapasense TaxID=501572 RepID=A0ABZ2B9V5_9HYPH
MRSEYSDFFELGGTNWINTAHQGALPLCGPYGTGFCWLSPGMFRPSQSPAMADTLQALPRS